jgi:putative transposase
LPHHEKKLLLEEHPAIPEYRQCELIGISRQSLYYTPYVSSEDIATMHAIDQIYTDYPFYGARRIRYELLDRFNISACRERIGRLMRVMGIEAIYPKERATGSDPNALHTKYPYLLTGLTAERPNHIWGTDITYIKLEHGFCYLIALIDWYSRYVVEWTLSPTLEIEFCLENITHALKRETPLIHNSDQGSHFTSPQYTDILKARGVRISMDGKGRCMDNIFTERLWRTVKYENVYIRSYADIASARVGLTEYFDFYNNKRRHQSLQYVTPQSRYFSGKNKQTQKSSKSLTEQCNTLIIKSQIPAI